MKAREYAISLGLAKPGKGKLSKAAHAAIQLAIDTGQVFDDYKDGKVVKNDNGTNRTRNQHRNDGVHTGSRSNSTNRLDNRTEENQEVQKIKSRPVTHEYSTIWGIDMSLRRPVVIAYQWCAVCLYQVRYCSHDIPQLPEYVGGGNGFTVEPTRAEIDAHVAKFTADS